MRFFVLPTEGAIDSLLVNDLAITETMRTNFSDIRALVHQQFKELYEYDLKIWTKENSRNVMQVDRMRFLYEQLKARRAFINL